MSNKKLLIPPFLLHSEVAPAESMGAIPPFEHATPISDDILSWSNIRISFWRPLNSVGNGTSAPLPLPVQQCPVPNF